MIEWIKAGGWLGYVSVAITALGALGIGGMLKTFLDYKFRSRKQTDDIATAMVVSMTERLRTIERNAKHERQVCEANLAYVRHKLNNISASLDATLLLVEMSPDKATEAVARIKELRQHQAIAEATERAAILSATIQNGDDDHASDIYKAMHDPQWVEPELGE